MRIRRLIGLVMVCAVACAAFLPAVRSDDAVGSGTSDRPAAKQSPPADAPHVVAEQLSVELARERATVMQDVHKATLMMLHDRYFHRDKSILPARAMQDIFSQIERESGVQTRWISASLQPMSIDHAPESDFEKRAAKEIAAGSPHLEVVETDHYRRAIAIPLTGGCLACHETHFQRRQGKQFAGLVISMPLRAVQK